MAAINKLTTSLKVSVATLGLIGALNQNALGADVSLLGTIDTTSSGKVSTAKMLKKGTIKSGLFIDSGSYAVPLKDFSPEDTQLSTSNDKLLKGSNKSSLFIGYGLFDWLELHLGIRSTTDDINSDNRKEFFQRFDQGGYYEQNVSAAESGFSYAGSLFSAKFLALDLGNLKFGVSGFVEQGIGSEGEYSASKSENYKFGYLGLVTYGYKDFGQVNFNVGYRSRSAEEVGGKHIGNEVFSKASVMYHITKRWGVYSSLESRAIKVAKTTDYDKSGYLNYSHETEVASQLGVTGYAFQNYKVDAYVGGGLESQTSVGNSERYFGLSLTVPLFKSENDNLRPQYVVDPSAKNSKEKEFKQVDSKINDDDVYSDVSNKPSIKNKLEKDIKKKKKSLREQYPEMYGDEPLYDLSGTDDDFERAKKRKKNKKSKTDETVDIDKEIEKFKEQDRRKEALEDTPYYTDDERRDQFSSYKKEKLRAEREVADKLKKELGASEYVITDEDANWTGLED
jgi:hypothetical protein